MTIALLQSAQAQGTEIYNHHAVVSLEKCNGQICGISTHSRLNDSTSTHQAKMVVNATGPFVDTIRELDDPTCTPLMQVSSGIHIVVDHKFLPSPMGLMIPETSDGRVLFVLPYQGKCLIGTSDQPAQLNAHPKATAEEILYLLENVNRYFGIKVTDQDILASFCGLRPLLRQEEATDTSHIVREHIEVFSDAGLMTVAGGKWTSYRSMAESAVDSIVEKLAKTAPCQTAQHKLIGSQADAHSTMQILRDKGTTDVYATYLYAHYGDQSPKVLQVSEAPDGHIPLHPSLLTTRGELLYGIRHEYVKKPLDFIMRRINLGLIDRKCALEILPIVCDIMQEALSWSPTQRIQYEKEANTLC